MQNNECVWEYTDGKNLLNFWDISVSVISVGVSISVISVGMREKKELDFAFGDLCEGHGDDPHTSLDVLQDFDWFLIDFFDVLQEI